MCGMFRADVRDPWSVSIYATLLHVLKSSTKIRPCERDKPRKSEFMQFRAPVQRFLAVLTAGLGVPCHLSVHCES